MHRTQHAILWFLSLLGLAACNPRLVGLGPISATVAAAADLNGDSLLDLVVSSSSNTNKITFLFGQGTGEFSLGILTLGVGVRSLAIADLDADSDADLAIVTSASEVELLMNRGDGSFEAPVVLSGTNSPFSVVAKDFNGDEVSDLVVGQQEELGVSENNLAVFVNDGAGVFSFASRFDILEAGDPRSLQVGDLDDDGDQDLYIGANPSLYLNDGTGQFLAKDPALLVGDLIGGRSILGDFDGDGLLDILIGPTSTRLDWEIAQNRGNATFELLPSIDVDSFAQSVAVGDFNADGALDFGLVLQVNSENDFEMRLFLNEGGQSFVSQKVTRARLEPIELLVADDLDGDGGTDLVFSNFRGGENQLSALLFR
jgi:hypothetical protein